MGQCSLRSRERRRRRKAAWKRWIKFSSSRRVYRYIDTSTPLSLLTTRLIHKNRYALILKRCKVCCSCSCFCRRGNYDAIKNNNSILLQVLLLLLLLMIRRTVYYDTIRKDKN